MSSDNKNSTSGLDEAARRYYLDAMGIQCWELRDNAIPPADGTAVLDEADVVPREAGSDAAAAAVPDWPSLHAEIQQCSECPLHTARKQAITGRGNQSAELMFVLLSPDSKDDEAGVICSGDADLLLGKMLSAINISIKDVYITSLLKCSVPAGHTVTPNEIQQCKNHLIQQVLLIQPELLVVLGETAIRCLLQKNLSLDDYRALNAEADFQIESVPVFASYSPQELLLNTEHKRLAWSDLQQLQKILEK